MNKEKKIAEERRMGREREEREGEGRGEGGARKGE